MAQRVRRAIASVVCRCFSDAQDSREHQVLLAAAIAFGDFVGAADQGDGSHVAFLSRCFAFCDSVFAYPEMIRNYFFKKLLGLTHVGMV